VTAKRGSIILVSGNGVDRHIELPEHLPQQLVLAVGGSLGQISGNHDCIRAVGQSTDLPDGSDEIAVGIAQLGADVGIAELDE
jgi:hypothetical protein